MLALYTHLERVKICLISLIPAQTKPRPDGMKSWLSITQESVVRRLQKSAFNFMEGFKLCSDGVPEERRYVSMLVDVKGWGYVHEDRKLCNQRQFSQYVSPNPLG